MKKIKTYYNIPATSLAVSCFTKADYVDSYEIKPNTQDSVDSITNKIFNTPGWSAKLLTIRDKIVAVFGLKTTAKVISNDMDFYPVGSTISFFPVINRNENEIIMGIDDKHLDFRVSTLLVKNGKNCSVSVTTIVKFNNTLGRMYFFIIKPFHRIIVKDSLYRYLKTIS